MKGATAKTSIRTDHVRAVKVALSARAPVDNPSSAIDIPRGQGRQCVCETDTGKQQQRPQERLRVVHRWWRWPADQPDAASYRCTNDENAAFLEQDAFASHFENKHNSSLLEAVCT